MSPDHHSSRQSQLQDEDLSPDYCAGSSELFQNHLYGVSIPGGWLKIWSVEFTRCMVNHMSPADNDTDLWIAVIALGPLLTGHLASD